MFSGPLFQNKREPAFVRATGIGKVKAGAETFAAAPKFENKQVDLYSWAASVLKHPAQQPAKRQTFERVLACFHGTGLFNVLMAPSAF